MNAVGIDVSKGKSMVSIIRPYGEVLYKPFEVKHSSDGIQSLIKCIKSVDGESRIVMEHTGRYYEVLAHQLSEANLFVSAVNPKLIKDFDNDTLRKVKSDKARRKVHLSVHHLEEHTSERGRGRRAERKNDNERGFFL